MAFLPKTVILGFSGKRVQTEVGAEWRDEWSETQNVKKPQNGGTLNRTVYRFDPFLAKIGSEGVKMTPFLDPPEIGCSGKSKFRAVNTRVEPSRAKNGKKGVQKVVQNGVPDPLGGPKWGPKVTPFGTPYFSILGGKNGLFGPKMGPKRGSKRVKKGSKRGHFGPFWGPKWVPEGYLGSSNTFRAQQLARGVETHFGHKNDQNGSKMAKNGDFGPILGPVPGPPLK